MPLSEVIWWIVGGFLALIAVFWLIASMWNLLHPRISIAPMRIFFDAAIIAVTGGLAYGIWINFLR